MFDIIKIFYEVRITSEYLRSEQLFEYVRTTCGSKVAITFHFFVIVMYLLSRRNYVIYLFDVVMFFTTFELRFILVLSKNV